MFSFPGVADGEREANSEHACQGVAAAAGGVCLLREERQFMIRALYVCHSLL